MSDKAVSEEWIQAAKALLQKGGQTLTAGRDLTTRPAYLFHFTDCSGLVNILTQKTLRASLATSLNDRSEVSYGVGTICALLKGGSITTAQLPLDQTTTFLELPTESRVYLISFCATVNTSLHWMHYGDSGAGVAIKFDSQAVEKEPYYRFPVIYTEEEQQTVVRSIIQTIDATLAEFLPKCRSDFERQLLVHVASQSAANYLWMAASRMKNRAFLAEQEWRLITFDSKGLGVPDLTSRIGNTLFRQSGGRVIPYKELKFDVLPAVEIVLGSSAPMDPGDLALIVLTEEGHGGRLDVSRSTVPIRG